MNKKTSKIFSIFWIVSGLTWVIVTLRHIIVKDDIVGTIIYIAAAIISFVLAFAYYRNFVK
jgi:TRAP-type C4-dicarboxylate transport system permease small subunit